LHAVRREAYTTLPMLEQPLRTAEFVAVDTETNGRAGPACELTEVGAVLVGGGELHDRWSSLVRVVAPLSRGIQRFTGITQAMVDEAPRPETVLPELAELLEGRVLVAHNAAFDRRVLRQAFERAGLEWSNPPVLCTVQLARRLLPLQRRRGLAMLAEALGIDVPIVHRALPDAESCGRVLCALFPRLCAHAGTVGEALALLKPARKRERRSSRTPARLAGARRARAELDFGDLPDDPGVYIFRDSGGRPLYVGKSVSIRSRARSHFAPSGGDAAWRAQAEAVDYRATCSELGALVLENRLIKELRPPGNVRLKPKGDVVYVRCRLDISFPILEVAPSPASGHGVTVGPLRGRRTALELVEQLNSLFGLRHCGRALPRRDHPSAYGQMGRCLSPCLRDLDPNLYRRRLDSALELFVGAGDGGSALLAHVEGEMRTAARERRYERAEWLRRRLGRLRALLESLDGVLAATHARPRLVLAPHPAKPVCDAFWLAGGRVADWGALPEADELAARTQAVVGRVRPGERTAYLPADAVDEMRIVGGWLAAHPDAPSLSLSPAPDRRALAAFAQAAQVPPSGKWENLAAKPVASITASRAMSSVPAGTLTTASQLSQTR
jgi:DNA polymerase III subunit epsilon